MICEKCGIDVGLGIEFCSNCGSYVKNQPSNAVDNYTFDMYIQDLCAVNNIIFSLLCNKILILNSNLSSFFEDKNDDSSFDKAMDFLSNYDIHILEKDFDFSYLKKFGDMVIESVNNSIKILIEENKSNEIFLNNFILNKENASSSVVNSIIQIFKQDLDELYFRIQNTIPKLKSYNQFYKNNNKTREKIGDFAKNFSRAVIAVNFPLIGIPMIISSYLDSQKNNETTQQQMEDFTKEWHYFYNTMNDILEKRLEAISKIQIFIEKKLKEALETFYIATLEYNKNNNKIDINPLLLFNKNILKDIKDTKYNDITLFSFIIENIESQGASEHFKLELKRI